MILDPYAPRKHIHGVGYAVAQLVVAGSIPDGVIVIFH